MKRILFPLILLVSLPAWPLVHNPAFGDEKPWIEVRSPHFRVLSDGSEKQAAGVALAFERLRFLLSQIFPGMRLDSGAPMSVFAVRNAESLAHLDPAFKFPNAYYFAGFFVPGWERRYAVIRLDTEDPNSYDVVYHEYVHSVVDVNVNRLPVWLSEGIAEFYGSTRFEEGKVHIGATSHFWKDLQNTKFLPLDAFLPLSDAEFEEDSRISTNYLQAWFVTHYLIMGPGMEQGRKLAQFVDLVQAMPPKAAFQQVFGSLDQLQKGFDSYSKQFAIPVLIIRDQFVPDSHSLSARKLTSAETLAEIGTYQLFTRHESEAAKKLDQAAELDPGLPLAHESLGFLHFSKGEDQQALAEFSRVLELDPQRQLSRYYKVMIESNLSSAGKGSDTALEKELQHVIQLGDQYAPAYVGLARIFISRGEYAGALSASRKAEQLEPSRAGYHLLSAKILLRMGRTAEAASIAKYVADRWEGADRDEALEVLSHDSGSETSEASRKAAPSGETVQGTIVSSVCKSIKEGSFFELALTLDDHGKRFTVNGKFLAAGFSDTLWYGQHFTPCHHLEGLRAVVHYRTSSKAEQMTEIGQLEVRDDLPEVATPVISKNPENQQVK